MISWLQVKASKTDFSISKSHGSHHYRAKNSIALLAQAHCITVWSFSGRQTTRSVTAYFFVFWVSSYRIYALPTPNRWFFSCRRSFLIMRMKFRSLIIPCAFKTASSSSAKSFMSFSRKISIKGQKKGKYWNQLQIMEVAWVCLLVVTTFQPINHKSNALPFKLFLVNSFHRVTFLSRSLLRSADSEARKIYDGMEHFLLLELRQIYRSSIMLLYNIIQLLHRFFL